MLSSSHTRPGPGPCQDIMIIEHRQIMLAGELAGLRPRSPTGSSNIGTREPHLTGPRLDLARIIETN